MSDVMEKDIREIRQKVDAIEKSVDLLVRANRKEIVDDILTFFGKSGDRARVFLAVDGEKSVGQIRDELGLRIEHVSRRLTELERGGLVRVKKTQGSMKFYEKTEKVHLLGLDRHLEKITKLGSQDESATEPGVDHALDQTTSDRV